METKKIVDWYYDHTQTEWVGTHRLRDDNGNYMHLPSGFEIVAYVFKDHNRKWVAEPNENDEFNPFRVKRFDTKLEAMDYVTYALDS